MRTDDWITKLYYGFPIDIDIYIQKKEDNYEQNS